MANQVIATDEAPKAIGPYSQAIVSGDLVFTSGQIPLDPKTQEMVKGDIRAQAHRVVLARLARVFAARRRRAYETRAERHREQPPEPEGTETLHDAPFRLATDPPGPADAR